MSKINASVYTDKCHAVNVILSDNGIAHPLIILQEYEAKQLIKDLCKELDFDPEDDIFSREAGL